MHPAARRSNRRAQRTVRLLGSHRRHVARKEALQRPRHHQLRHQLRYHQLRYHRYHRLRYHRLPHLFDWSPRRYFPPPRWCHNRQVRAGSRAFSRQRAYSPGTRAGSSHSGRSQRTSHALQARASRAFRSRNKGRRDKILQLALLNVFRQTVFDAPSGATGNALYRDGAISFREADRG